MRSRIASVWLFAFVYAVAATAAPVASLDCLLDQLSTNSRHKSDSVAVLWFPGSIALEVEGELWNGYGGWTRSHHSLSEVERGARSGVGRPVVRFGLRMSATELSSLQSYLESNQNTELFQSCVSGACKAIRRNSSLNIVHPFAWSPSLTAMFLAMNRSLKFDRVVRVEFIAPEKLSKKTRAAFKFASGTGSEAIAVGGMIGVVVGVGSVLKSVWVVLFVEDSVEPSPSPTP